MRLGEIKCPKGSRRNSKSLGQGPGSGTGKTAGKGHKGQRARSGARRGNRIGFVGGTLAYFRHLPKIGFSNVEVRTEYQTVNVGAIESVGLDGEMGHDELLAAGLIRYRDKPVKILGEGSLSKSISIKANNFSQAAREKIEKAGGKVELI